MSEPNGAQAAPTLVLRISVPADGDYRVIVKDLAARVAAYSGDPDPEAQTAMALLDRLARSVAPADGARPDEDITVEFHQVGSELVIQARCDGRSADARHPLPSGPAR